MNLYFDAVCLGRSCVDFLFVVDRFPERDTKTEAAAHAVEGGGQAATAAVTLARLGARVAFAGKTGDDELGRFMRERLEAEGVDLSLCPVEKGAVSPSAAVIVEKETGKRTIVFNRGTVTPLRAEEIERGAFRRTRVLLVDSQETPLGAGVAGDVRSAGGEVVYDAEEDAPGLEAMISRTDYLIGPAGFPLFGGNFEEGARALLRRGPLAVVVTLGEKGCAAFTSEGTLRIPPLPVSAVDTTGAGDAFHGAFVFGLLRGFRLEGNLRFSSAVAALSCTALGGRKGLPTYDEALAFMNPSA